MYSLGDNIGSTQGRGGVRGEEIIAYNHTSLFIQQYWNLK
jgi:hypothetical protein